MNWEINLCGHKLQKSYKHKVKITSNIFYWILPTSHKTLFVAWGFLLFSFYTFQQILGYHYEHIFSYLNLGSASLVCAELRFYRGNMNTV